MAYIKNPRRFASRNWLAVLAAFGFLKTGTDAVAQNQAAAKTTGDAGTASALDKLPSALTIGPLTLHPRADIGFTADDNILLATNQVPDTIWKFQPALQVVMGDDAAMIAYRDQNSSASVLGLTPGSFIVQPPEAWPGKLLVVDYGPRFQFFGEHSINDSIDEFAQLNALWPMAKLILGFQQDYALQTAGVVEAGQRTTTEMVSTRLSAGYQFGEKTSLESSFKRLSNAYDAPGLVGYTEYNTEDWLNYVIREGLPVSLGVLAGWDEVANHQSQTYEQLRARARYFATEKLAFDASVGGEMRQYENGNDDTFTPVFSLSMEYQVAERTSLRLTGYRQQSAAVFNGYNYTSTGATVGVHQGFTDRFGADFSVGYYTLDYASITSTQSAYSDDYYNARLSLDAKIVRHLTGQMFYQLLNRQSSRYSEILDNQVGVNLTLSY